jgi:2-dehydro-3-deoxyglucarate aldolase/4-hydroxy-2-oxoheptanedioate aldolase
MLENTAKKKLARGEAIYGTSLEIALDPEMPLLLSAAGLDFFFIDTEHSPADYHQIRALCRSAKYCHITALVRVTQNEPHLITRALDSGAAGIIVPRVHSSSEAEKAAEMMKYPPHGNRGFGMHSVIHDFRFTNAHEEMDSANQETMTVLQIESAAGLAAVGEIAQTPVVDALFVGPYDLSISMGIPEQFQSAEFWDAIDRVISACRRPGIAAGIQSPSLDLLCEAKRRGMTFLLYASDSSVLLSGYREGLSRFRSC